MKTEVALKLALSFFQTQEIKMVQQCQAPVAFEVHYNGHKHWRYVQPMSEGYLYGIALNFARNYCEQSRLKSSTTEAEKNFLQTLSSQPNSKLRPDDSLIHVSKGKIKNTPLVETFALVYSLGMIESDGNFKEGRDKAAFNVEPETAEAGLFQVSYDSQVINQYVPENIYRYLLEKYNFGQSPNCMNDVYSINQEFSSNQSSWGWGEGLKFQDSMKLCPALATDYMAYLLRITHKHNGPLLRKDAQAKPPCQKLLSKWEHFIHRNQLCNSLDEISKEFAKTEGITKHLGGALLPHYRLPKNSYTPLNLKGRPEWKRVAWLNAELKQLKKESARNKKRILKIESEISAIQNNHQNKIEMIDFLKTQQKGFEEKISKLEKLSSHEELKKSMTQIQNAKQSSLEELKALEAQLPK